MRDRGRRNSNERGSSHARRARKTFLLNTYGNGQVAQCWECSTLLTAATVIADRIIPGCEGGTYRRNNIRPHCPSCSHRQGQAMTAQLKGERK